MIFIVSHLTVVCLARDANLLYFTVALFNAKLVKSSAYSWSPLFISFKWDTWTNLSVLLYRWALLSKAAVLSQRCVRSISPDSWNWIFKIEIENQVKKWANTRAQVFYCDFYFLLQHLCEIQSPQWDKLPVIWLGCVRGKKSGVGAGAVQWVVTSIIWTSIIQVDYSI